MSYDLALLWTIQLAPLAAFLLIQLLPRPWKRTAPLVGALGAAAAALSSLRLWTLHPHAKGIPLQFERVWLEVSASGLWPGVQIEKYTLSAGFLLDPLNLLMITLVTVIAFFVQVFSMYYMAEDPSRPRYFAFLSFFSFAMTGLVLSSNLLQTFLFWELVGLASYLLIGFWYEKPSASTAARKAFVLNRLGDLGFYLGIILLFLFFGTLDFAALESGALAQAMPAGLITIIGILVLNGVMGKSAQFPFHVWLPDAMEGPTPVSALIHSATMVAAGVFLLARAFGLFGASETMLLVILVVGTLTALVGAALGTTQKDIKKIMAYSTVSQLGLMVMAVGAGAPVAAMFHLSTHAFFKSLLFLTAGAFIHHFHSNDIWEIGRRGGKKDLLAVAMLCLGLFSLCGLPPLAGFFSKDMILEALKERSLPFYFLAIGASLLTSYYSCRLLFVILFSGERHTKGGHHEEGHHGSALLEACRAVPLVSLGAISLYVGYLGTPAGHSAILHILGGHDAHLSLEMTLISLGIFAAGASAAYILFKDPAKAEQRLDSAKGPVKTLLDRKFFMDDLYQFLVKGVGLRFAAALNWVDKKAFNRLMVDMTSYRILDLGRLGSRLQNGSLQDYLVLAVAVSAAAVLYLLLGGAR